MEADTIERELPATTLDAESSTVALLNKSEIDQQIVTAHRFPRTIRAFRDEVLTLATITEDVAEECSYALPRDGKTIIGPSARFAEILASAYGNCRAGARIVDERSDHIVAQGAFLDLQKNVAITYEVQRRIVNKSGIRFSPDMIGVTANAACSIALRNAILKGVPKALWADLWEKARKVAIGDVTTLANRRAKAVEKFAAYGVTQPTILTKLGRASLEDVTLADVEILLGLFTAIKDGDSTPEEAFSVGGGPASAGPAVDKLNEKIKPAQAQSAPPASPPAAASPAPAKTELEKAAKPAKPKPKAAPSFSYAEVADRIAKATDADQLAEATTLIEAVSDPAHQAELRIIADRRESALMGES